MHKYNSLNPIWPAPPPPLFLCDKGNLNCVAFLTNTSLKNKSWAFITAAWAPRHALMHSFNYNRLNLYLDLLPASLDFNIL